MRRGVSKRIGKASYPCQFAGCGASMMEEDTFRIDRRTYCGLHHGELTDAPRRPFNVGTPLLVEHDGGRTLSQVLSRDGEALTLATYPGDAPPEIVAIEYSPKAKRWWEVDSPIRESFHQYRTYEMVPGRGLVGKRRRRVWSANTIKVSRQTPAQYREFRKLADRWRWWFLEAPPEAPTTSVTPLPAPAAPQPPVKVRRRSLAPFPCPHCRRKMKECECRRVLCPSCGKPKVVCSCLPPKAEGRTLSEVEEANSASPVPVSQPMPRFYTWPGKRPVY